GWTAGPDIVIPRFPRRTRPRVGAGGRERSRGLRQRPPCRRTEGTRQGATVPAALCRARRPPAAHHPRPSPDRDGADTHRRRAPRAPRPSARSEEHTSELQSRENLVCRLLLEKKNEQRTT